jgi:RHS repeat-associated protein
MRSTFDWTSDLYHVRHRTYHPTLGRWLQRDPAGYVDGMGLYEYVSSEPIMARDPRGLEGEAKDFSNVAGVKSKREWLAFAQATIVPSIKKEKDGVAGWITYVKDKIVKHLCSKKCIAAKAGTAAACERQAKEIATTYVTMYFSIAYSANTPAYIEAVGGKVPYFWWKKGNDYRAGLRCYNWMMVSWHAVRRVSVDLAGKNDFFVAQRAGQAEILKGNTFRLNHNFVVLRSNCNESKEFDDACSVRLDPWLNGKPEVFSPSEHHSEGNRPIEWNWVSDAVSFSRNKTADGRIGVRMKGRFHDGKQVREGAEVIGKPKGKNPGWSVTLPDEVYKEELVLDKLSTEKNRGYKDCKTLDNFPDNVRKTLLENDEVYREAYRRWKDGSASNGE